MLYYVLLNVSTILVIKDEYVKPLRWNLQVTFNMQLARDPITAAIEAKSCKEMGGVTSHACQSGARSVSER